MDIPLFGVLRGVGNWLVINFLLEASIILGVTFWLDTNFLLSAAPRE